MLIKLNGVTFNPDLIVAAFWTPITDKNDELVTRHLIVHLSQNEGGRKITLPAIEGEKLELFLAAHNLIDLDGPAFQKTAFERTASLKADLQAREAIRDTLAASEQLKLADGHLTRLAGQSARQGVEGAAPIIGATHPPVPTLSTVSLQQNVKDHAANLSIVPPTPPTGDDFEPDLDVFVAKNPRHRGSFLDNL